MMFSDIVMRGTERGCSQVAFEYDITKAHCLAAERQARATLLEMLPDSNARQRSYYWAMCTQANRFGVSGQTKTLFPRDRVLPKLMPVFPTTGAGFHVEFITPETHARAMAN